MKTNKAPITDSEILAARTLFADWPMVEGGKVETMKKTVNNGPARNEKPRSGPQGEPLSPAREKALSDWLDSMGVPPIIETTESGMEYIEIPSVSEEVTSIPDIDVNPTPPDAPEIPNNPANYIPDGTYTVVWGTEDDYRTLRFRTQDTTERFAPGETIVEFLSGDDNESSYTGCAFYKQTNGNVVMWKRFRGGSLETEIRKAVLVIRNDPEAAGMAYAMKSGRCRRCGRKLTVPASLHRGFGPDCAAQVGIY